MARNAGEHETTDQFVGKAHEAVDRAGETFGRAEEYAREHVSQAEERAREAAAKGRRQADDAVDRANSYVRENPLMSIGIAFIVGVLFSWLTARRR